jgi:EmrB/QacA subfamily drug resistance transporter
MLLLDVTIVIVALPDIQHSLHADFTDAQWVIDAYSLAVAAALVTFGSLADRYGRRLIFTAGLAVFTAGSLICGLAQSPLMLILARAGQGIGASMLFATSLALLAQTFEGKDRGVAFGAWGTITGVATGLGPVLGGVLTSGIGWRAIFLINVPIGIAALIVARWKVDEFRTPHAHRPDWAGFAVLTTGLGALIYGIIRAGEIAWSDTGVVISLAAALVLLTGFIAIEATIRHPLFDLGLFRVPTFNGGLISAFCMNGSQFAMTLYLVLYLQDDLGYSALGAGLRLLLASGAMLVAATAAGRASNHIPARWLIGPGLAIVAIGLFAMSGLDAASSWTHLAAGLVIAGIGSGLVNPPLASTAVGVVTPERSGMASGINTTFRQIGLAVGIAAYGTIFTASLQHHIATSLGETSGGSGRAARVVASIQQGNAAHAIASVPATVRTNLIDAIRTGFASSLNELLVISGTLALAGAICALALIRGKDFIANAPNQRDEDTDTSTPQGGAAATPTTR